MESKQNHIRDLIRKEKPGVFGIQETKMTQVSNLLVNSIWGNSNMKFVAGDAIGLSRGTLLMLDSDIFSKEEVKALVREVSDHCPIMLSVNATDFGPKSFKLFDHWMENSEFNNVVQSSWSEWDAKTEAGLLSKHDCLKREEDLMDMYRLEQKERDSLKQKSRVKWSVEGDENTKFFHAFVNKKGRKKNLNGLNLNGVWLKDPSSIFMAALKHFSSRFHEERPIRTKFRSDYFRRLDREDVTMLESAFTMEEVKAAVWDCSSSKSPGLDGLNFNFIKRQILDGSLIANEIVNFAKKARMNMLLFKVDFEKAFDCVNWDILLDVMTQMNFGSKWCQWIRSCLSSASVSVLINGSPSKEFKMERGLRQGDPLSPFLFLIIAEALQVMCIEDCNKGIFRGLYLADEGVNISLLQYADDALFFGEWSKSNALHFVHILDCFHDVSSLKSTWQKQVIRFSKRLATWKRKLLSIGGMLTLVKSVLGSLPLYYQSIFRAPKSVISHLESIRRRFFWGFKDNEWVRWQKVLCDKKDGGLGVGILIAKTMRLLGKWKWRFLNDRNSLWRKVIKQIYGPEGDQNGIPLTNLIERKVYSSKQTEFWNDGWIKDRGPLKNVFPRLYALETQKGCFVSERYVIEDGVWQGRWAWRRQLSGRAEGDLSLLLSLINTTVVDYTQDDKWIWTLNDSGMFSVSSLCRVIQKQMFVNNDALPPFIWNSWVPRKVNVCTWRLALNRLPTRTNLARRGVSVSSQSCLFCGMDDESREHCFLSCPIIKLI
ncbi:RNA-directed DNA polymerase, eukaryota, reverse transcriptase zinc-binding domain protein [Tanacetum coccineum]